MKPTFQTAIRVAYTIISYTSAVCALPHTKAIMPLSVSTRDGHVCVSAGFDRELVFFVFFWWSWCILIS